MFTLLGNKMQTKLFTESLCSHVYILMFISEQREYLTGCGIFSCKISQAKFERVDYISK